MGKRGESTDAEQHVGANSNGEDLLNLPRFAPFLSDNFNVAEFTSKVLGGSHTTASAQSEQLRDGVHQLEFTLSDEVVARNKELLNHVRRMLDAENSVRDLVLSVESLQSAVRRIRAEVVGPYEQIKHKTQQLRNIHATVDILRHVIHRLKLAQKLRAQLAVPAAQVDLAKAAKLITDIRAVDAEVDLSGIDAVAADAEFLESARKSVQEQAEAALTEGVESLSQARVGSALQVIFNLNELHQAVSALLSRHLHDIERALRNALDSRHLAAQAAGGGGGGLAVATGSSLGVAAGGAGTAGRGQAAPGAQDRMWQAIRDVLELISSSTVAVWHLQRVVAKKKDPLTHVCFLDVLVGPGEALLVTRFWSDVVRATTDAFASVAKPGKGGFVRDTLTASYPRLAGLLEAMFERLTAETTIKGVLPAVGPAHLQQLLAATGPFQTTFMAGCLSRLTDAVAAAFPGSSRQLPSATEVQKCIGLIHEELKVGSSSPQLAAMMAATAAKALNLLAERAEYSAASGPELRQLTAGDGGSTGPNAAQLRNIALCSQLQETHRSLSALLTRLPPTAAPALGGALAAVQATAVDAVAPIFRTVVEACEERLLRMHEWPGYRAGVAGDGDAAADAAGPEVTSTSPHVAEVAALLADFRSEFLSRFLPPPTPSVPSCVGSLVERMACRLLVFFVRHASLLRPLTQAGKLLVAKDLAELQAAVGQQLHPLEQLGGPFRAVKAFRALLFAAAADIGSNPLLGELPPAITLQHLFSRLPASIKAPHERSGLTPLQYSLWLDSHSAEECLRGIAAALAAAPGGGSEAGGSGEGMEALTVMRRMCAAAGALVGA
ncbi:component of oligomeric golgi complex 5 [Volvox carteri f. nagariensis]|uniref:Conserved oligomeric Golgi complex subunit 5 n=1 Tax=Volvox carteri f. nagariensis TaxID=3068 RepID=D8THI7_VOLCA|nr:component of oligomeric golgi complex 5 [Volvox carteri f. nagariensis]EFJ53077.1 component of oligomeric golgi complex 5 [Volvox carteri f. nagariensis]|eukprot:XP_002946082.1 component of oligomeric golgi complex 5 [Volvox carteri f. nagariensis]